MTCFSLKIRSICYITEYPFLNTCLPVAIGKIIRSSSPCANDRASKWVRLKTASRQGSQARTCLEFLQVSCPSSSPQHVDYRGHCLANTQPLQHITYRGGEETDSNGLMSRKFAATMSLKRRRDSTLMNSLSQSSGAKYVAPRVAIFGSRTSVLIWPRWCSQYSRTWISQS